MVANLNVFQSLGARVASVENKYALQYAVVVQETELEMHYAKIRQTIAQRRQALAEEIGRHPRPITGCDVHFNRLLEERAALSQELDRFDAFIAASTMLTPESKDRIRAAEENVVCP